LFVFSFWGLANFACADPELIILLLLPPKWLELQVCRITPGQDRVFLSRYRDFCCYNWIPADIKLQILQTLNVDSCQWLSREFPCFQLEAVSLFSWGFQLRGPGSSRTKKP
jgi:hypothetical protein